VRQPPRHAADRYLLSSSSKKRAAARDGKTSWHLANPLDDGDRCFSESSRVFPQEPERLAARALALERGKRLVPAQPLGHEDTESLIVFGSRCPNNTLLILWADSATWTPLFPRH
jgi:hypothetical protein